MLHDIAVLIDADNVSHQRIDWIFEQINHLGQITTKRIYGDFTKPNLSSWENAILKYAIEKKHQTSYSTGKNSSDLALAIDAIDLWHTGRHDAFCIISSDSDFIGLALRLRQGNIQVFGFGENKTIKEFRQVCSEFFEVPHTPSTHVSPQNSRTIPTTKIPANQLKCDTKLLNALKDGVINNKADNDGWVNYAVFSSYFQKNYPAINSDGYGYGKLYELIDVIDIFDVKKENTTIFVRIKTTQSTQPTHNLPWTADKLAQHQPLIHAIKESINHNLQNDWANFSAFTLYLHKNFPNIKPSHYGHSKWRALVEKIGLFEVNQASPTTLFIREKQVSNNTNSSPKIHNKVSDKKLLDDILTIINENNRRDDEWVHIGYLGGQLKNKSYNPKDFGFKTFGQLLLNTDGVIHQNIKNGDYFSLSDKSQIKPITHNNLNSSDDDNLTDTKLYQLLLKNKDKINNKIKELLLRYANLNTLDFWRLLSKNLPDEFMDDISQNHDCFVLFVHCELHELDLMAQEHGFLFCASGANTH